MKGVVFRNFLEMAEARFGLAVVDRVLTDVAPASAGAYTTVGTYPHEELVDLVQGLAQSVQASVADLLFAYGQHLFSVFASNYRHFFVGVTSGFDFVAQVHGHIHVEVRKLYPDAELPHFATERTGTGMTVRYSSPRPFVDLARGLLTACFEHFGEAVTIAVVPTGNGAVFTIRRVAEAV